MFFLEGETHFGQGDVAHDVIWTLFLFGKLDDKLLKDLRLLCHRWPVLGTLDLQVNEEGTFKQTKYLISVLS